MKHKIMPPKLILMNGSKKSHHFQLKRCKILHSQAKWRNLKTFTGRKKLKQSKM